MKAATVLSRRCLATAIAAIVLVSAGRAAASEQLSITLASTTSTEQSGLFAHLLPIFRRDSGIEVRVVAVGTGQALQIGRRGDADALLVHDRAGEDAFVAEGHGIDRRDIMHNDFVLVGPGPDPARVGGVTDAVAALRRIAGASAAFASRGDDSGTHRLELRLWRAAGIDVKTAGAGWYRELGSGMGPTLNTAAGLAAYTLTDRGTWANFRNRQDLVILVDGDARLFNPYGSILINPERHPTVKHREAKIWHEWLSGEPGQQAIAGFRIGGEQLFFPARPAPSN